MKTMQITKWAMTVLSAALLLSACGDDGSVPKAYRGTFQGQNGVTLTLSGDTAQLVIGGKTLKGPVEALDYDKLTKGQSGYYIYQEGKKDTLMDVYWVTPDVTTKKEAGGILYYTTDIVYMQIDLNQKDPVQSLTIVHAANGTVMLDTQSKQWQAGWPAQSTEVNLVRTGG